MAIHASGALLLLPLVVGQSYSFCAFEDTIFPRWIARFRVANTNSTSSSVGAYSLLPTTFANGSATIHNKISLWCNRSRVCDARRWAAHSPHQQRHYACSVGSPHWFVSKQIYGVSNALFVGEDAYGKSTIRSGAVACSRRDGGHNAAARLCGRCCGCGTATTLSAHHPVYKRWRPPEWRRECMD